MWIAYLFFVGFLYDKQAFCAFPVDKVSQCKAGDTSCIKETSDFVSRTYPSGLKEMNLNPIDPLIIDRLSIENGGQSTVRIKLYFTDIKMYGLSKGTMTRLTGLKSEVNGTKFNFEVKSPYTIMLGKYKINGQILILPIQGEGTSNMTFIDPVLRFKSTMKTIIKNGEEYAQIDKATMSLTTTRLIQHFSNLFNGNKELGDTMNEFLNENWADIYKELKASIEKSFVKVIKDYINNVFSHTPYKQLFKE